MSQGASERRGGPYRTRRKRREEHRDIKDDLEAPMNHIQLARSRSYPREERPQSFDTNNEQLV